MDLERLLDRTGRQILWLLQRQGRMSWSELGRRVGLSAPAAAERVRKLQDVEIISGFHAEVSAGHIGLPIEAFIQLTTQRHHYPQVLALAEGAPEVLECHHLSGAASFVLKVVVASTSHLASLIARLSHYGQTTTSIVLSSPVIKHVPTDWNTATRTPQP